MISFNPLSGEFVFSPDSTAPVTSVAGRIGAIVLTKTDVGLGSADNTSDAAKPISTLTQTALNSKADLVGGFVPTSQIPAIAISDFLGTVASQAAMLALSGQKGDWAIRSDTGATWVISGADPTQLSSWTAISYPAGAVTSVNGQTGIVVLSAANVGAQVADNTLTALAGLTTSADKLIYATGSDVFSTTDFTSFARTLLDDTTAATARSTLGLAIGTDVQAYNSGLAALAALTGTSTIYYRSGANTWSAVTIGTNLSFASGTLSAAGGGGGSVASDVIWDALGDLAVGLSNDLAGKLTRGANDTLLMADGTQTTGLRWATPASVRTALGLNNFHPLVLVRYADGTHAEFQAAANTDAARGDALRAAIATLTINCTCELNSGKYDLGTNSVANLPAGTSLLGAGRGATFITSDLDDISVFVLGDRCFFADLSVENISPNAASSVLGFTTGAVTVLRNVAFSGITGWVFKVAGSSTSVSAFDSAFDTLTSDLVAGIEVTSGASLFLRNCDVSVNPGNHVTDAVAILSAGTVKIFGGTLSSAGGTSINAAVRSTAGTVDIHNVVTTVATAVTNYDLQSTGGTILYSNIVRHDAAALISNNAGGTITKLTPSTGTGSAVHATSPTLVTPILGAATATSLAVGLVTSTILALGITTSPALLATNTTAAAVGAQQVSPSVRWTGQGWKTTATAASQPVDFRAYVLPVQGTTNPSAKWILESSINAGAFSNVFQVDSTGIATHAGQIVTRAGATGAGTAPIKLVSGSLNTTAEAGAFEFLTDAFYLTITTGAARKSVVLGPEAGPITFAGTTSARTITVPADANYTAARQDAAQTFAGLQTFTNGVKSASLTSTGTGYDQPQYFQFVSGDANWGFGVRNPVSPGTSYHVIASFAGAGNGLRGFAVNNTNGGSDVFVTTDTFTYSLNSVGIGLSTFGSSAAKVLGIGTGTEPTTSPIDMIQLYSVDISAGNASLGLRTETAVTASAAGASDAYLNIRINGTTYKLLLHT